MLHHSVLEFGYGIVDLLESLSASFMSLSGFNLIFYILGAVGTYTIAKRRNIRHAWLSWLPVGICWIWGCISDQYQHVAKGKVTNRRKVLLGLSVAQLVPLLVMIYLYIMALVEIAKPAVRIPEWIPPQMLQIALMIPLLLAVSAVLLVFIYVTLYDLFRSCDPDHMVLYLIMSILFYHLSAAFIFAVRKLDLGMPLRKSTDPEQERPYEL